MAAYAFAKITFPFREPLFILFLATMMVPGQVTIIPLYLIMKISDGWIRIWRLSSLLRAECLRGVSAPAILQRHSEGNGRGRHRGRRESLDDLRPHHASSNQTGFIGTRDFTFLGMWNNFFNPLIFLSDG